MVRTLPLAAALALLAGACTHRSASTATSAQASTAAAPDAVSGGMESMCPMGVPGTEVSAEDTETGVALTFTTTPDQVPALRERIAAMAAMHNRHHAAGAGAHGPMHGGDAATHGEAQGSTGGGMHGGHGAMHGGAGAEGHPVPPPATAAAEDVEGGARLVLTAADPADVPALRSAVRAHAERMQRDGCGSMGRRAE